jgi:hypothetical protein
MIGITTLLPDFHAQREIIDRRFSHHYRIILGGLKKSNMLKMVEQTHALHNSSDGSGAKSHPVSIKMIRLPLFYRCGNGCPSNEQLV